jgi:hypothetical protein
MDVWQPALGEIVFCERERTNRHDPFAVAIINNGNIVGHIPKKISAACSMFLRKSGESITCKVTGKRQYSCDLAKGGLEIPCQYIFSGADDHDLIKVKKVISIVNYSVLLKTCTGIKEEKIEKSAEVN